MGWPWRSRKKKQKDTKTAPGPHPIQTERLVLRAFDITDAMDVYAYAKSPKVGPMAGWLPHESLEESQAAVRRYMTRGDIWAMVEKKSGRVVGAISLQKDLRREHDNAMMLGYSLGEDWWGRGYATEAGAAMLSHAFETLGCSIVTAYHFPDNPRSERVLKKLGFAYEGTLRMAAELPGAGLCSELCYSMVEPEFRKKQEGK